MPISSDEFNKGYADSPQTTAIYEFLKKNNTKAFTIEEIYENLNPGRRADGLSVMPLLSAVLPLIYSGRVEQGFVTHGIGANFYYRAK